MSPAELACCGDTAFSLQHDVERHQIGPLRLHQRICGSRVPGLTNHFDVAAALQRGDENLSEQNMIVHHQHTHEYPRMTLSRLADGSTPRSKRRVPHIV